MYANGCRCVYNATTEVRCVKLCFCIFYFADNTDKPYELLRCVTVVEDNNLLHSLSSCSILYENLSDLFP